MKGEPSGVDHTEDEVRARAKAALSFVSRARQVRRQARAGEHSIDYMHRLRAKSCLG